MLRGGEERGVKEACPSAGIIQIKFTGISQNSSSLANSPDKATLVIDEFIFCVGRDRPERSEHPDAIFQI
jgi:hypothetical protein